MNKVSIYVAALCVLLVVDNSNAFVSSWLERPPQRQPTVSECMTLLQELVHGWAERRFPELLQRANSTVNALTTPLCRPSLRKKRGLGGFLTHSIAYLMGVDRNSGDQPSVMTCLRITAHTLIMEYAAKKRRLQEEMREAGVGGQ